MREWLNVQAASSFVEYDPEADAYGLPPEHALVLADDSTELSMTGVFEAANAAVAVRERLAERFVERRGRRLARAPPRPVARHGARVRGELQARLVAEWLPALDGVVAKLEAGALVADVGCGHGASTILMAEAFPASRFVGIDYHADSIAVARERAAEAGVADRVTFEVAGAAELPGEGYDLVAFFDSFHDLGDPLAAARRAAAGARARRHLHARRAVRGRPGRGQPRPGRALPLRVLDARLHAGVAVAARARRARHPGRRGAAARACSRPPASATSGAPPRRR